MTKKNEKKSGEQKQHKKTMNPSILQEEFSSELGDYNSTKIYDVLEGNRHKIRSDKEKDDQC
ncbi:hypothetical protein LC087_02590 [Bacillus carboniphilus]|uniref:Uncharacterized protein n=1 Tax=Bacillus carboniphilus TaxID=86663 RepID=A0ABY9JUP2_9BACI|nr:hypothetical protein [Bacillus carboniphilus]WLR43114.1 hypothetical protein LC087_02590 [Bacillus carboniphilus]